MIERGLNTEHHAAPGQFVSFIYNQGGALVKWFRDTFAAAEREHGRRRARASTRPCCSREMPKESQQADGAAPLHRQPARRTSSTIRAGVIAGLKLETSRGEILKAILEGTTFYLRESLEALPGTGIEITDFRAVGGGSRSDTWIQICADILNRPFVRPKISEAGVSGAAILAGLGSGVFPSLQAGVDSMVELDQRFSPDPDVARRYDQALPCIVGSGRFLETI